MIKVSTMLYVTKNGVASEEITREFLETFNVPTVLSELADSDDNQMFFDDFLVDLLMYEVEESFVKYLFARRTVDGLIYCGTTEHPDVMLIDLRSIIEAGRKISYLDVLTGEDVTGIVEAHPEQFNIVRLEGDNDEYVADVCEVDIEEIPLHIS